MTSQGPTLAARPDNPNRLTLTPGTRLGVYEVTAPIGEGGMGRIYQATDTTLGRQVAIKILPDAFAADPERLSRFEREARTLASLNHPHIAAIYAVEKSAGMHALVMELVEGDDLSQRIAHGAIPIEEALPIAKQIAEALEAAHDQGIIHRDLKPANIKVRADGTVKLLDFGLAKTLEPCGGGLLVSSAPTIASPALMTGVDVILGTAAYMSPEQARGNAVDKRSDIWAFGCVLYEMLTANRAFEGDSVPDVFVAVLNKHPEWARLPADTPAAIRRLLVRCVEKDRKRRLRDIGDALIELDEAAGESADDVGPLPQQHAHAWQRGAFVLVAIAVTALSVWGLTRPDPVDPPSILRFELRVPLDVHGIRAILNTALAVSPDGSSIVYAGQADGTVRLFRRAMDQLTPLPIAGTENGRAPFFSPDGLWVGFEADGALKRVLLSGGPAQSISQIPGRWVQGAAWAEDGTIIFAGTRTGLFRVAAAGGNPVVLTTPDEQNGEFHSRPEILPGNRAALFNAGGRIEVVSFDSGERRVLTEGTSPHFSPTGHVIFARGSSVWAVPFDVAVLEVSGEPRFVLDGVENMGSAQYALSTAGTLAYLPIGTLRGDATRNAKLIIVDRQGRTTPLAYDEGRYQVPRLAPDGHRLVVYGDTDFWLLEIDRPARRRLTFMDGRCLGIPSVWTHDGTGVAFRGASPGSASSGCAGLAQTTL
jgi:serine/threonine protein kinase